MHHLWSRPTKLQAGVGDSKGTKKAGRVRLGADNDVSSATTMRKVTWKVAVIVSYYTLFRRAVLVNLELHIVYDKRPTSFRRSLSLWFCLGVCKEARAWRMLVVVFFFIKVVWDKFHISFQPFSFWIPQQSFITNSLANEKDIKRLRKKACFSLRKINTFFLLPSLIWHHLHCKKNWRDELSL